MKRELCPICKQEIIGYPALSRVDNETEICSDCGTREAMAAFNKACAKEDITEYIK